MDKAQNENIHRWYRDNTISYTKPQLAKLMRWEPWERGGIYMPRYSLYPSNPQVLHNLVVELFVHAPVRQPQKDPFVSYIPHGPIYKYGPLLASAWKDIFLHHPIYKKLILITWAELPDDVNAIVTSDTHVHTFFWTIDISQEYVWWVLQSHDMFAMYAWPLEAQFPFIRAYKHFDNVAMYIVNTRRSQDIIDDFLDSIEAHHGSDVCYVFVWSKIESDAFIKRADHKNKVGWQ